MSKAPTRTTVSPVANVATGEISPVANVPALIEAQTDYRALVARIVSENPDAAKALALASLFAPSAAKTTRNARATKVVETESERACRCAQFSPAQARGQILTALINALGDKDSVSVTEGELCDLTGIAQPKMRSPLTVVAMRLGDFSHPVEFPLVPQIGYSLAIEGENAATKIAHFSRNAKKAD